MDSGSLMLSNCIQSFTQIHLDNLLLYTLFSYVCFCQIVEVLSVKYALENRTQLKTENILNLNIFVYGICGGNKMAANVESNSFLFQKPDSFTQEFKMFNV